MSAARLPRRDLMRGAVLLGVGVAAGGFELVRSAAAYAAVPEPRIYGTAEWGARPPRSAVSINNYRPTNLIIHHTATSNSTDYSLSHAFALSRSIQNWHMDNNGWIDTGQHFTISRGGYVTEGRHRSLETLRDGIRFVHGAHAGSANSTSIGIENEGTYTSVGPTTALYDALVDHCAYICQEYGIATSRIIGHRDVNSTACPGDVLYSRLPQLRADVAERLAGGGGSWSVIVDNATAGRFTASANWGVSTFSSARYGTNYRYADPVLASDAAWFKVNLPEAGTYRVEVWYPSNAGYSSSTPHVIVTTSGNQVVNVDQRSGGGAWRSLGTFSLAAGDRDLVAVSRWTTATGYVIADAVRVTKI
ncbi:MAG: N-acetylmuramoyl-L-alanine amidase [Micromonosporaceae bacterium]